jgi:hypothetical protein
MRTHTGKFTGKATRPHLRPSGIAEVRARLTGLQLNPRLAPFARAEIEAADMMILQIEQSDPDKAEIHERVVAAREAVDHAYQSARLRYYTALSNPTPQGRRDDTH